jgi:hypothetical protein
MRVTVAILASGVLLASAAAGAASMNTGPARVQKTWIHVQSSCGPGSGRYCAGRRSLEACIRCAMGNGYPRSEATRWCRATMPSCS